jgi:Predicted phosphohydrolases
MLSSAKQNTTEKQLALLNDITVTGNAFKFAFITDVHYFYNSLSTVIDDINNNDDILFVIVGGDMTEQAVLKEYDIFYDMIEKIKKPYLTVIGNHDYKSNGSTIYNAMFGAKNYSFNFNNNKFILFDNIIWESNKIPDFNWLSKELENTDSFNQVFVLAHIPPYGDQFTEELETQYRSIMAGNNVDLSIHGHRHKYIYDPNTAAVSYLAVPALKKPEYCIINVANNAFNIELIQL